MDFCLTDCRFDMLKQNNYWCVQCFSAKRVLSRMQYPEEMLHVLGAVQVNVYCIAEHTARKTA